MKIEEHKSLADFTTFRMGGTAQKLYIPESVEELTELCRSHEGIMDHVLGGGSNLLINDEKTFEEVLCLRQFNDRVEDMGDGRFYIGASVRLQRLIRLANENGYGGIEYLYSVPGLVGGAVYMNAGRGIKFNKNISDYIISVDCLEDGEIKTLEKEACRFGYRSSVFQEKKNAIIVGAVFQFEKMEKAESERRIQERINLCKRTQDMSSPNFGTVFSKWDKIIINLVKLFHVGYKDGITFSGKTGNWLLHRENGTFRQAVSLIERVKKIHRTFRRECVVEVRIWE